MPKQLPLTWHDYSGAGHLGGAGPEGTWKLGAPSRTADVIEIRFQLPGLDEIGYTELRRQRTEVKKGSYDWWRLGNMLGHGFEQGYTRTQDEAKAVIEVLRSAEPEGSVDDLLTAAGFTFAHTVGDQGQTRVYGRRVKGGSFTLFVGKEIHLTFEKPGATSWTNLLNLSPETRSDSGQLIPYLWPERLENNFVWLGALAAITVSNRFIADGRSRKRMAAVQ